jgi:protein-tyrosine-phosphatase
VCPMVSAKKSFSWDIPDPKGKGEVFFAQVRDQIREKVENLISEILRERD